MNCIVIDDDIVQHHFISGFINQTKGLKLSRKFTNAIDALSYLKNNDVDLIFLDVEMPEMTGIEFLEKFKPNTNVILITSKKDYAIKGFDNDVQDFLVKPFSFSRFTHAISKVKNNGHSPYIVVKSNGALAKVHLNQLLWVQSASEYLILHTTIGKEMIYSTMGDLLKRLPDNFFQVHRSNIVNLDKIESIKGNTAFIGNHEVKISRTYLSVLKSKMLQYKK